MDSHEPSSAQLLGIAILFEGGLAALALVLGWVFAQSPTSYVHWDLAAVGLGCLGSLPMLVVMLLITHFPIAPLARLNRIVSELIVPLFQRCSVFDFATISLLAGIGEELLFRGVIQAQLARWLSPAAGLVLASILFGLVHTITVSYAVLATVFGLYLGLLWLWTDNLLVAIAAHAIYDFVALAYLVRRHRASAGRLA
jgi:hypothetical protein